MIKWPVTYTDYNGDTVKEEYYFNLNKAELIQMQFDANGTYAGFIQRIVDDRDYRTLGKEFRKIILFAYGKKSDDGKRFIKSQDLRDEFEQTEAYATIYYELLSDTDKMNQFIQGVLPADLREANKNALSLKS